MMLLSYVQSTLERPAQWEDSSPALPCSMEGEKDPWSVSLDLQNSRTPSPPKGEGATRQSPAQPGHPQGRSGPLPGASVLESPHALVCRFLYDRLEKEAARQGVKVSVVPSPLFLSRETLCLAVWPLVVGGEHSTHPFCPPLPTIRDAQVFREFLTSKKVARPDTPTGAQVQKAAHDKGWRVGPGSGVRSFHQTTPLAPDSNAPSTVASFLKDRLRVCALAVPLQVSPLLSLPLLCCSLTQCPTKAGICR